ncbi:hypothetical protein [Muriicola sp. Z0-33]|uniref:hypothetical protein n=1 Tax=Muriicola sp. Z0-33 TaxID=2816957 RepID=UPI002238FFAD|nr:hypothetical protein [Muriicola sp. Z0-33]MCW5516995.1 hypothetical protein [Muriicola sp. Z0-33]
MGKSKFHQLCGAYSAAQDQFENYKKDCHTFSIEIVKELKAYYEIPEGQFSLYRIDDSKAFHLVAPALIHAIDLKEDNYWHFGIGLTVCKAPETLPEELILIHIKYRKNSKGQYFLQYEYEGEEFEVFRNTSESYIPFFDFLFTVILNSYKDSLQRFVGVRTERKLGFVK